MSLFSNCRAILKKRLILSKLVPVIGPCSSTVIAKTIKEVL